MIFILLSLTSAQAQTMLGKRKMPKQLLPDTASKQKLLPQANQRHCMVQRPAVTEPRELTFVQQGQQMNTNTCCRTGADQAKTGPKLSWAAICLTDLHRLFSIPLKVAAEDTSCTEKAAEPMQGAVVHGRHVLVPPWLGFRMQSMLPSQYIPD